eukprot:11294-Prymnesium_polylepis.1
MESMLGDGHCDAGCNIVACQHDGNDCNAGHTSWLEKLKRTQASMASAPLHSKDTDVPLTLRLKLHPITVIIDDETGGTYARQVVDFDASWSDPRLFDIERNPALDVWATLVSLSTSQAKDALASAAVTENMAYFLFPSLSMSHEFDAASTPNGWTVALAPSLSNSTS